MELEDAKMILNSCVRGESRDHAFGDCEVFWTNDDGEEVASGYFGGSLNASIYINDLGSFDGDEARELRNCGKLTQVSRNDETGPDEFVEGRIAPGLSLEDVRKELTGD